MKKRLLFSLTFICLITSYNGFSQIISQYIETSSGTSPKGIEVWNNTNNTLNFTTNNLVVEKGSNGNPPSPDFTLDSGSLAPGKVIVIGSSDLQATAEGNGAIYYSKSFNFNGDDALVIKYGGTTTDTFGNPGAGDPGTGWQGNGVQTYNQNISLKDGITTGDTDGWTDPSERFETTTTDNSLTGFGIAPNNSDPVLTSNIFELNEINYAENFGPSDAQSFELSGLNLNNSDVTVTAPTNYEVSEDNSSFENSITLTSYDGSQKLIYVRLKAGLTLGDYNHEIVSLSGGGDPDGLSITVNGSVIEPTGTFNKLTSLADFEEGWYVITNQNDEVLLTNVRSTSSQYDSANSNASGSTINNPKKSNIWYIALDNGNYTIKNDDNNKYISWSSSTSLKAVDNASTDKERWTVDYDTDHFTFANVSDATRLIRHNQSLSTPGFKAYKASSSLSNSYIQLFKKEINTVWNGNTSTNWSDATNWSDGVPTSSINATIPNGTTNTPVASGAISVKDLTIESNATLEAQNTITSNTIIINSGGSLITESTVNGTVTYNRVLNTSNWYLISSPVSGETIEDYISNNNLATGTGTNVGIAPYKNDGTVWDYQTTSSSGDLTSGKGFSTKLASAGNITFTGSINSSNVSYAITQSTNNFNLVGNPFTSYVNLGTFFTDNSGAFSEETIWVWNQASNSYDLKMSGTDASFQIAPGQGFFVSANANTNITFNTSNQSHQSDSFQKNGRTEIELFADKDGTKKSTKLFFIEGTTKGFDNGYDGSIFGAVNSKFNIYTQLVEQDKGKKLAIQSLPLKDVENVTIPIGITAKSGETIEYSIATTNLPKNITVYLEDTTNKTSTNLFEENYTQKVNQDIDGIGQFFLRFASNKSNSVETPTNAVSSFKVFKPENTNKLTITGVSAKNIALNIYTTSGKQVVRTTFNSNGHSEVSIPKLSLGVYIVEVITESERKHTKIIIN